MNNFFPKKGRTAGSKSFFCPADMPSIGQAYATAILGEVRLASIPALHPTY